jgi:hypothetical protein
MLQVWLRTITGSRADSLMQNGNLLMTEPATLWTNLRMVRQTHLEPGLLSTPHLAIQPPVILFSHIPLYRPEGTDCGPLRERGTIRQGFGTGYQNTLGQDATNFLLQKLKPSLILRFVRPLNERRH